jgi:CubicO group peptidase (beta-lactamase class C family)
MLLSKSLGAFKVVLWMGLTGWCASVCAQEASLQGEIRCGPSATGAPGYSQSLSLRLDGSYASGLQENADILENQELVIDRDGRVRYNAIGLWKSQPQRRWRIHATGQLNEGSIQASGRMYGDRAQDLVRSKCDVQLAPSTIIGLSVGRDAPYRVETLGEDLGVSPSSLQGGAVLREWGLERGMPWSYRRKPSDEGREIRGRDPSFSERAVIQDARQLLVQTRVKAMVFVDAGQVVGALARPGVAANTLLPSASMSKTVTALGVGKAICAGVLNWTSTAQSLLPELTGRDLGQATLRDILLMSSRSSETETQHTHGINYEETRDNLWSPNRSVRDLVAVPRIAKARFASPTYDYKSTDPYLAALMTQQATGVPFTQWLSDKIFSEARLADLYVLDTDRQGNFLATAGVRLSLNDWIRLAVYIQEQRDQSSCFGQFIRDVSRSQIAIPKIQGVNGYFSGYSYFTWTANDLAQSTAWAVGAYGQRIGWSTKAGNRRVFLTFGDGSDPDMNKIYPLADRWIN